MPGVGSLGMGVVVLGSVRVEWLIRPLPHNRWGCSAHDPVKGRACLPGPRLTRELTLAAPTGHP